MWNRWRPGPGRSGPPTRVPDHPVPPTGNPTTPSHPPATRSAHPAAGDPIGLTGHRRPGIHLVSVTRPDGAAARSGRLFRGPATVDSSTQVAVINLISLNE